MYTGTHTINGSEYTFNSDGSMVTSAWVGNKYYGADGVWIPILSKTTTGEKIPMVTGISSCLMVLTLISQWESIDGHMVLFQCQWIYDQQQLA